MRKLIATILTLVLFTQLAPIAAAKQKGDWNMVKVLVNKSIAFKTRNGETRYGFMEFADDNGIKVRLAGENDLTSQQINVSRNEIEKVWRAKLRFGERNIAKAAWIGAGVGLGATVGTSVVLHQRGSDDAAIGVGLFPLVGAGIGAIAGAFWKKKHKKQDLIYSL